MFSVGLDMGGTFTDGYFTDGTRAAVGKVPTTHFDLTRSVMACLDKGASFFDLDINEFLRSVELLRVATTIGTNSVVEGTGDAVGVMVDESAVESLYGPTKPSPAIGTFVRADRVVGADRELDGDDVLRLCRELVLSGVRQVVVSFDRDGWAEERRLRDLVRERYPAHYLRSIPLTTGTEVVDITDDELRTHTAIVNAYLTRPMAKLLYRTEGVLQQQGLVAPLLAARSDATCGRVARTTAISTYSSGPAAGLSRVADLARARGEPYVLGFDMGGTTLDLGLVTDGRYAIETTPALRDVRVAIPVPQLLSVGLGGSSIARTGDDGSLAVGPGSAGAIPGPAAYARGGSEPTLTDADLVTGLLSEHHPLSDDIALDAGSAREALDALGVGDPTAAAVAVTGVAHETAAARIGQLLVEAEIERDQVVMYAFGGAGPLHAAAIADLAGINHIRSFSYGGVFSARGVAGAPVRQRYEATIGISDDAERVTEQLRARSRLDLHTEHLAVADAEFEVETDNGRIFLTTTVAPPPDPATEMSPAPAGPDRDVWWNGQMYLTPEVDFATLHPDTTVTGPAIVMALGAGHAVPPGWTCRRDGGDDMVWEKTS